MRLTWLGHSSVLVETGGLRVVADPLLRRRTGALRRLGAVPAVAAGLADRGVDAVLLSHLHHDHCDVPSLRALRAPLLIAPPGSGRWLDEQGLTGVVELAPGDRLDLGAGVRIVATPAEHLGRREPWGPTAMAVGHLVEGVRTAWLAGDTGLFAGMAGLAGLARHGRIDVAAVPVWGWGPNLGPGHLDPRLAAEAVTRAGARLAVPVHWGTLHPAFLRRAMTDQLHSPGRRFAEALDELGATAEVLPVGGTLSLG
jgi:L-ascorbate metabolism protein UlaG (beta-lactamase superfamily)